MEAYYLPTIAIVTAIHNMVRADVIVRLAVNNIKEKDV
jgi:hypothetical protein